MLPVTTMTRRLQALLVVILLLSVAVIGLAVTIVYSAMRRPVAWAPDGSKLTALSSPQALTETLVVANAEMLLGRLETWGYPTVKAVPDVVSDFIHPQLLPDVRLRYETLAQEAARGRLYRAAIPGHAQVIEHSNDLWTVAIPYRETTWFGSRDNSGAEPSTAVFKVGILSFIQLGATDGNPYGLRLTRRPDNMTRKEWHDLRAKQPALPDLLAGDNPEIFLEDPAAKAEKEADDREAAKAAAKKRRSGGK